MKITVIITSLLFSFLSLAQFPVRKDYNRILFVNASAFIDSGNIISRAAVGVENGEIILIKNATEAEQAPK